MKYLFLFLISLQANAACFLTSETDQNGDLVVMCTRGFTPRNVLCSNIPRPDFGSRFINVDIVTPPDGFLGNIRDLLGLNSRPWTPTETVAEGERIVCTRDTDAIQAERARLQAEREAETNARQARAALRGPRINRLRQCVRGFKNNSLNANQQRRCLAAIIRQLIESELDQADLEE